MTIIFDVDNSTHKKIVYCDKSWDHLSAIKKNSYHDKPSFSALCSFRTTPSHICATLLAFSRFDSEDTSFSNSC